jgi:predicted negative regulator of RcsB-dependent stress response
MANGYETEEEQIEAIKRWWHENGRAVIAGVVVAVVGFFGWQQWLSYQSSQSLQAAQTYQGVLQALNEDDRQSARDRANQLIADHGDSVQAVLANLRVASAYVEAGDYEVAEAALRQARDAAGSSGLKPLATLRLAQVVDQRGEHKAALDLLQPVSEGPYAARYHELRGDIKAGLGERDSAVSAYQAAISAIEARYGAGGGAQERARHRGRVQLKLADLGADAGTSS